MGGSNLNAGSAAAGAAAYTATNGNWSSTTGVFTPTSGNPSLSVAVGDFCSVYPDAATVGVFVARVTAVSATTVTLSTTAKAGTAPTTAGTGVSLKAGGAWKGPNGASGFPFGFIQSTLTNAAGNAPRVNLKGGTSYAITAAVAHANNGVTFQGYAAAAGDGGRAVIDGGTAGASYALLSLSATTCVLRDLTFQNNGASGSAVGVVVGANLWERCVVHDVRGHGFHCSGANHGPLVECEAYACNQGNATNSGGFVIGSATATLTRCVAHDNVGSNNVGFVLFGGATLTNCIADTNGSHGVGLLGGSNITATLSACSLYANVGSGIHLASGSSTFRLHADSCIFVNNGVWAVNNAATAPNYINLLNNAYYNNTSGMVNGTTAQLTEAGAVTLTGSPFVDAANGDFRLNNTAGAGQACRGTGRGAFTQTAAAYAGTVSFPDIGAAQHQEVASGGGGGGVLVSSLNSQLIKAGW